MDLTKLTDEQRDYFSRTSGPYLAAALKLCERAAIHAPIDEDVSKIIWDEVGILQSLVAAFGRLAPKMYNVEDLLNSANPAYGRQNE